MNHTVNQAINDIDTLHINDLECTRDALNLNMNDDIDAFIRNAKMIQSSINEALNYDQTDNRVKEEV